MGTRTLQPTDPEAKRYEALRQANARVEESTKSRKTTKSPKAENRTDEELNDAN